MLPLAEEVAPSLEPEVLLRDLEAVVGLAQGLEPLPGLRVPVSRHQHAEGFVFFPAHSAPQLVQLAEAEAVGVFNDHQGGVGHIHPPPR